MKPKYFFIGEGRVLKFYRLLPNIRWSFEIVGDADLTASLLNNCNKKTVREYSISPYAVQGITEKVNKILANETNL